MKKRGKTLKQRMEEIENSQPIEVKETDQVKKVFMDKLTGKSPTSALVEISFWFLSNIMESKRVVEIASFRKELEKDRHISNRVFWDNFHWLENNHYIQKKLANIYILNDCLCDILNSEKKIIVELQEVRRKVK